MWLRPIVSPLDQIRACLSVRSTNALCHNVKRLLMKVHFGQIYIEPGIAFPFSHHFQRRLAADITSLITPSAAFIATYGADWELMIRISAKTGIDENEIRGPSVYMADKGVEFSVFVPYDVVVRSDDIRQSSLQFILNGCREVFRQLEIDSVKVSEAAATLIKDICSDHRMFAE